MLNIAFLANCTKHANTLNQQWVLWVNSEHTYIWSSSRRTLDTSLAK